MHFVAGEKANEVYDGTKSCYQNLKCDLREIFFPFVRKASQIQTLLEYVVTQLGTTGLKTT